MALDFSDSQPPPSRTNNPFADPSNPFADDAAVGGPTYLQRNKTERARTGGIATAIQARARGEKVVKPTDGAGEVPEGYARRLQLWMINEGPKRLALGVFFLVHFLVLVLGAIHYQLKDNLVNSRATFGETFVIARAAALVLHVDAVGPPCPCRRGCPQPADGSSPCPQIFIMFPICRNFISLLRRTPLNDIIPSVALDP